MAVDSERIQAAVAELLAAIGEDPARPGLVNTPARVAQSYAEFFSGLDADPAAELGNGVPAGEQTGELVLMRGIDFRSMCEHHLLPFTGVAHVAYVPAERLAGLGRLPRVVDALASRPQLQERLTDQIADALQAGLEPRGVLVVLDAQHDCVSTRGPRAARSSTVTVASRGSLATQEGRAEAMALITAGGA
ncbi:GTP cyclohydrolase I FolE [Lysobacter korlensis]|uniref:GTP cyclohydrolase 1 n=1 Tax=Lysobacter korlensis TaxID=553636 RepID=A0ABV6RU81_9GAMM